jgi:hypothetical protein
MAAKKEEKLEELKKHLSDLQNKIIDLEDEPQEKTFEVRELFTWKSPIRVYRKRSKKWAINVLLMIAIILVILLFLKQFILMAAILALGFLLYVLDAVPPEDVEHRLSTEGITTGGNSFLWEELYDFWFKDKGEYRMLHIDTHLNFPRRLLLLVKKEDEAKVKETLLRFIPFREKVETSWIEKTSDKLAVQFHHLVGS